MPKIRRRTGRELGAACLAGLVATCACGTALAQDPAEPGPALAVRAALVPDPDAPLEEMPPDDPVYLWVGEPFWLAVEVAGAGEGDRVCVVWVGEAPDGVGEDEREGEGEEVFVGSEAIEVGPGGDGPARLLFTPPHPELWRPAAYRALVFAAAGPRGCAGEPAAEVRFGIGERMEFSMPPLGGELPSFPWPPPQPTDRMRLSDTLLGRGARPATLGQVADRLTAALTDEAGYRAPAFYAVREGEGEPLLGFALVTTLELIRPDGTPAPGTERWSQELPAADEFSLARFLRALFEAPRGDYRVIAFVVTRALIGTTGEEATREQAEAWLAGGRDRLPPAVAALPYEEGYATTALVYQFRQVGHHSEPEPNPPGAPSASQHLENAGILPALRRP